MLRAPREQLNTRTVCGGWALSNSTLAALLGVFCCALSGCEVAVPPLVSVHDVSPALLEPGETARVRGKGFPEGRPARLVFEGNLRCAGVLPPTAIALSGMGQSESEDTIVFELDAASQQALNSAAGQTRHCAFTGRLDVAFSPELAGAPPVAGGAEIGLDFFPPVDGQTAATADDETAAFLGAEFTPLEGGAGVRVESLAPSSRLRDAGFSAGDIVVRADGLRAVFVEDLEPAAGQTTAHFWVRREAVLEPIELVVNVAGYRPQQASLWRTGLAMVAAFCATLLLSRTQALRAFLYLLLQAKPPRWERERVELPGRPKPAARATHGLGTFLSVSALLAAMTVRAVSWSRDLDLVVLVVAVVVTSMLCQLLDGGTGKRWSLGAGLMNILRTLPSHMVVVLCVTCAVMERGTLSLFEQSANPAGAVGLLSSPPMLLSGAALAGAVVLQSIGLGALKRSGGAAHRLLRYSLELAHLLLLGGLFCGLYLDSVRFPDWLMPEGSALARALSFQLKCSLVFVCGLVFSRAIPVPRRYLNSTYYRRLLPTALLSCALGPVWSASGWPIWLRESAALALPIVVALVACGAAALLLQLWRRRRPALTVNPWL